MKLCICISGQIRDNTEEPMLALKKLISNLEKDGHEITVIFSIWAEISRKLDGVINIKQLKKIFAPDLVNLIPPNWYGKKLWQFLPKTFNHIKKHENKNALQWVQQFFPEAIIDCEPGNLLDLKFDQMTTTDNNSKIMLYKIWRANEIKRKIERDNKKKFDFVIRVRPDYTIKKINLQLESNTIYIPSVLKDFTNLEDTFAMGSSEAIDYYCELFPKSIIPSAFKWRGIHAMLAEHFNQQPFAKPIYQIKNAQKNAFIFKHMTPNSQKLDIQDLTEDLNSEFFQAFFSIIQLRRKTTDDTPQIVLEKMEQLSKLCHDEDSNTSFFILLHEIYISQSDYMAALKSLLLADFQYLSLNPKKVRWNHRLSYLFNQLNIILKELPLNYRNALISETIVKQIEDEKSHPLIDHLYQHADKSKIIKHLKLLTQSEKGSALLTVINTTQN